MVHSETALPGRALIGRSKAAAADSRLRVKASYLSFICKELNCSGDALVS
jgi:hypothetical protein